MADDRMKNDEAQRNMGGTSGREGQGQQSPGRSGQSGQQSGQHAGGQQGGQFGGQQGGQQGGQFGGQKDKQNIDDDDEFATGGQQRGGQNR